MGSRLDKNSESVRKRIESHTFQNEGGEEYEGSKFGGFSDYFRRKKIKLQNLDAEVRSTSTGNPNIFRGIVAHVNGYTQPSLNDLHHLIVSHGGGFMQYLDGKTTVTHIIASTLPPKKAIEFKRYRIVKPAWIVDSVKAGKCLPWDSYRVLDEGVGQRLLGFSGGKVVSQSTTPQRGYRDQTNASWYTSQVKNVAEDIDDDEGPQFPSSQVQNIMSHNTGAFMSSPADQLLESIEEVNQIPVADPISSAGSFGVTSSLEEALKQAAEVTTPARKAALNSIRTAKNTFLMKKSPSASPSLRVSSSPTEVTPTKPKFLPIIGKRSQDDETLRPPEHAPTERQLLPNTKKRSHDEQISNPPKKAKIATAEEHNAMLLADPRMRKSTTANPDFIKQYYSESRLHHLSTWKADLKSRFQQMASEMSASQKQSRKRKPGSRRYVMHVDFDSFFCAVSLKNAPEYVDKPAVVAHGNGNGSEIASCNYPAREFGVKNGMWMKNAIKLCSELKVLPYDFPAYEEASKAFYESILNVGGIVQSVSVDEALIDITSLCLPAGGTDGVGIREGSIWREQEKADEIGNALRNVIKEKTGCNVSVGIGGNILLAKVALRKAKPAGQHQIKPEEALDFIGELGVQNLPGVAYSIGGKLEEIGVKFVKDVRQLSKDRLMTVLGPKTGEKIWDYSRGIDKSEVGEQVVRKSVSAEVNWGIRFISQTEAEEFVQNLCIELQRRLIEQRVKGRQLTMKIMRKSADAPLDPPKFLGHGDCDTFNKSIVLGVATNDAETIGREAISVLRSYGFPPGELRGLGVQMTKLEPVKSMNGTLFDGSQRKINFGTSVVSKSTKQVTDDPLVDGPETPTKRRTAPYVQSTKDLSEDVIDSVTPTKPKLITKSIQVEDPIDESSPLKAKPTPVHPATFIARTNAVDQSARKLNLTGTQFIVPSQIDPEVLKELPQDIRSRLMAQSKSLPDSNEPTPATATKESISEIMAKPNPLNIPSQLDPEVFDALPEEMKAEILASYKSQIANAVSGAQTILPQSPRKNRTITGKAPPTPVKKRGRGRPPGPRIKPEPPGGPLQSKFAPVPRAREDSIDAIEDTEFLDPEFLAALPEDMREEIIAEHRRKRLQKRGGLMTSTVKKIKKPDPPPLGPRRIRLPPRPTRPTFTTQELSTLDELRETLTIWYREFEGEGPHPDDVSAMERYLKRVIMDERDLGKAVGVVRWLGWLIDDSEAVGKGKKLWGKAYADVRCKVQEAVKERGLGKLDI
ncbi:deoxycytidyl transferase [Ciborinia camelliae]|nr:deoxycytidyl transferase [Ciborinia camelliae]